MYNPHYNDICIEVCVCHHFSLYVSSLLLHTAPSYYGGGYGGGYGGYGGYPYYGGVLAMIIVCKEEENTFDVTLQKWRNIIYQAIMEVTTTDIHMHQFELPRSRVPTFPELL